MISPKQAIVEGYKSLAVRAFNKYSQLRVVLPYGHAQIQALFCAFESDLNEIARTGDVNRIGIDHLDQMLQSLEKSVPPEVCGHLKLVKSQRSQSKHYA